MLLINYFLVPPGVRQVLLHKAHGISLVPPFSYSEFLTSLTSPLPLTPHPNPSPTQPNFLAYLQISTNTVISH